MPTANRNTTRSRICHAPDAAGGILGCRRKQGPIRGHSQCKCHGSVSGQHSCVEVGQVNDSHMCTIGRHCDATATATTLRSHPRTIILVTDASAFCFHWCFTVRHKLQVQNLVVESHHLHGMTSHKHHGKSKNQTADRSLACRAQPESHIGPRTQHSSSHHTQKGSDKKKVTFKS